MDEELKNSVMKTGTSIVGIVCADGVVLAADRQASMGSMVGQKDAQKITKINDFLLGAICGTASDAQYLMRIVAAELKLKDLKAKRRATVKESASLLATISFRNIRSPSMIPSIVGTLVAGVDEDGKAKLYSVEPAGGVFEVKEYDTNFGSGTPYMLGVLERMYKKEMNVKQGAQLALECLKASTQRDTASGFGVEVYTLTKDGIKKAIDQKIESVFT